MSGNHSPGNLLQILNDLGLISDVSEYYTVYDDNFWRRLGNIISLTEKSVDWFKPAAINELRNRICNINEEKVSIRCYQYLRDIVQIEKIDECSYRIRSSKHDVKFFTILQREETEIPLQVKQVLFINGHFVNISYPKLNGDIHERSFIMTGSILYLNTVMRMLKA